VRFQAQHHSPANGGAGRGRGGLKQKTGVVSE